MNFVSCDWGTTNFRLRLIGGPASAEVRTDDGAAKLAALGGDRAAAFRETLARGLAQLGAPDNLPVVISGMASSTIGWRELPYARLPFALDGRDAVCETLEGRIHLISGIRSKTDMARGEETQALGLAAALGSALPDRATLVLPGTHSKHLTVDSGAITGVRTFMTGELFDLLVRHSVLRHSTEAAAAFDPTAFAEGVAESRRQPLAAALFRVRTRQVLDGHPAPANTAFLSGLLIGAELGALAESERPVIVAAGEALRIAYAAAAEGLGLASRLRVFDAEPPSALGQEVLLRRNLLASR
jgi:2-dehydro-3-deoxygalactonokinase